MKQLIGTLFLLLLSGCQIDPYTHAPTWTGTAWYDAGIQDAISGYAVKDNETLADNYNDPEVDRTEYLKGYAEGQRKICQPDFVYARGLTGKTLPPSCDTVENIDQLHSAWQKGANEGATSIRLN
ncbi:DUF2799 domain-containing protein [Citrobacter braakii]|uniref:DUF2799 domain-containing protein n=1 Tax=Citrobacter braakii TaxID=57706 RepID=UPI000541F414|nr:DUF2799 domain-containing protein [Citrobacter braakii]EIV2910208.1 DUF2799 domain-containing protein [Citrobacter braakii]KHE09476.1 lipoprotein [Citrobacter braakii]WFX94184.1 DUF2799 domain-containing protein [Citrobacter braakii]WFY03226.1 DUF2799 domain-containing protein [Citrobacter braakii]